MELERLDPTRPSPATIPNGCWSRPDGRPSGLDLSVRPAMVYVWGRLTKLLDRHPVSLLAGRRCRRRPVGLGGKAAFRHLGRLAPARRGARALSRATLLSSAMDLGMARRAVATDRTGRLDPPAPGVRLAGAAAAPGADLAARVDEVEDATSRGIAPSPRSSAGWASGWTAQAGRGQPAGDPPLAGAYKGFRPCCTPAARCVRTRTTADPPPTGWWPPTAVRRCSPWCGWSGRRGGGSGWTDWTRPRRTGSRSPGHGRWTPGGDPALVGADQVPMLSGRALGTAGVMLPAARRGSRCCCTCQLCPELSKGSVAGSVAINPVGPGGGLFGGGRLAAQLGGALAGGRAASRASRRRPRPPATANERLHLVGQLIGVAGGLLGGRLGLLRGGTCLIGRRSRLPGRSAASSSGSCSSSASRRQRRHRLQLRLCASGRSRRPSGARGRPGRTRRR